MINCATPIPRNTTQKPKEDTTYIHNNLNEPQSTTISEGYIQDSVYKTLMK